MMTQVPIPWRSGDPDPTKIWLWGLTWHGLGAAPGVEFANITFISVKFLWESQTPTKILLK